MRINSLKYFSRSEQLLRSPDDEPLIRLAVSMMPRACAIPILATPRTGVMYHPQSRLNVHAPRIPDMTTSTHSAMTVLLVFLVFSVMVILMLLMTLLSPHPSGRLCRITLVDARMRRLKVECWGAAMVAMPGQPTLSGMLCLSNNTFGQNANICQQKLIYISIYERLVKWVLSDLFSHPIGSSGGV